MVSPEGPDCTRTWKSSRRFSWPRLARRLAMVEMLMVALYTYDYSYVKYKLLPRNGVRCGNPGPLALICFHRLFLNLHQTIVKRRCASQVGQGLAGQLVHIAAIKPEFAPPDAQSVDGADLVGSDGGDVGF